MNQEAIIRQLRPLNDYGNVYLFGSTARNENTAGSDIDIAILASKEHLSAITDLLKTLAADLPFQARINERYGPKRRPEVKLDVNIFTADSPAWNDFMHYPHPTIKHL